jgi:hypothetical protein
MHRGSILMIGRILYIHHSCLEEILPPLYIFEPPQFSLETYISHIIVQKQVHRTCLHGIATDNYENFVITKFVEHHTDNQAELCFLPPYILEMYYVIIRPKLCDYHDSSH